MPNAIPESPCVPNTTPSRPMRFRASSSSESVSVHRSPSKHHLVYHMPRITPNAILFITLRQALPPMRACVSFQDSPCGPYGTHHAQRVSGHCPLPSITLCTICHASRPMQLLKHLAYQMPRITPNAFPCIAPHTSITLRTTCHATPPIHACVTVQESTCVPCAKYHAQCVSVHRPLPSISLYTICHALRPMSFRASSPSEHHHVSHVPRITPDARFNLCTIRHALRPMCFRASSPSKHHFVNCMQRITPNAIPFITLRSTCHASPPVHACVSFQASTCVPYARHQPKCVSVRRPLPSITLCSICNASCPM